MDNYIFNLRAVVTLKAVSYPNRFGIKLDADLYLPVDFDKNETHSALVIGSPYGGTKEQSAGLYAQEMAHRGYVALTFDPSFYGYSGGNPRHVSSPEIYVEDFSAGVDYLGVQSFVDPEKIGVLGICGSGGFALSAAQIDPRIQAVATVSMYDISRYVRDGLGNTMTDKQRKDMLNMIGQQRFEDFKNGRPVLEPRDAQLAALTIDDPNPVAKEFADFYVQPRGYHHNALAQHTLSSNAAFMNFSLLAHLEDIAPRQVLLVAGDHAHSLYFSEDVHREIPDNSELYLVKNAGHVDLYDNEDKIPYEKLDSFFTENLK